MGHLRQAQEPVHEEVGEALEVGGDHPQQVVGLAAHRVALEDLRQILDRLIEGLGGVLALLLQADVDEGDHAEAEAFPVQERRIDTNSEKIFECPERMAT